MNHSNTPAAPPSAPALWARDLTVRRGERVLFENLSFTVSPGDVLLLRGANGVGKSTLLLTLAGIIRPETGTVGYQGADAETALAQALHLLTYQHGLKPRLSVAENLGFWRTLYGPTGLTVDAALDVVGLATISGLETGYLSSGQTRRLSLARLLVSKRPVWLLDEPSATLDAAGEKLLGRLIDDHRTGGGITIIATHHDLPITNSAGIHTMTLGDK